MLVLEARALKKNNQKLLYVMCMHAANKWAHNNYLTASFRGARSNEEQYSLGKVFLIREITQDWENTNYKVFNICRCDSKSTNCCVQWSLCERMWSHCKCEQVLWSLIILCSENMADRWRELSYDKVRQGEACSKACLWWINGVLH